MATIRDSLGSEIDQFPDILFEFINWYEHESANLSTVIAIFDKQMNSVVTWMLGNDGCPDDVSSCITAVNNWYQKERSALNITMYNSELHLYLAIYRNNSSGKMMFSLFEKPSSNPKEGYILNTRLETMALLTPSSLGALMTVRLICQYKSV